MHGGRDEETRTMDIHQFHRMQNDAATRGKLGQALEQVRDVGDVESLRAAHIDRNVGWIEWQQSVPSEDGDAGPT
jgi:hypothetical protein